MNKWLLSGIVVAVIIVAIIIIASISVCPADVKVCPDGSYVARSGLGCAFAQCPVAFCVDLGGYTCIDQDYYLAGYYTGDEYGYCSAGTMNALISSPILVCCTEPCQSCAKEGDFVNPEQLKGQTEYLDECCSGLKGMGAYKISDDGECEQLVGTPFLTCTPCGDGVCEDTLFENSCNCPEDCGETIPVCEKDKKFAENVSSNPLCTKEDFICLDGWETIAYYDHRLTDTLQLPEEIYTTTGAPQKGCHSGRS